MKNFDNFTSDLSSEELKSINDGDDITKAFFRFLGWCSVVLEAGMNVPHANEANARAFE